MKLNISLVQFAIILCVGSQALATFNFNNCGCNDEGIDVCSGVKCNTRSQVTAPRPYPIQSPRPAAQPLIKTIWKEHTVDSPKSFSPIGDVCNCGKQIVKPAPMPNIRELCTHQFPKFEIPKLSLPSSSCTCNSCLNLKNSPSSSSSGSSSTTCNCGEPIKAPEYRHHDATIFLDPPKRKSAAASPKPQRYGSADVVSVAIAQRLANSAKNGISERQLQYGSLKEPTIPEKKVSTSNRKVINVNEESFYSTNGDVLEIQSNMFRQKPAVSSEESEESEEAKPKSAPEPYSPAQLRYEDIGYGAYEQKQKPRYVVVKNSKPANHDCNQKSKSRQSKSHHHKRGQSCNCYSDLVVDQSAISEQSLSYENNSSGHLRSFST